MAHETISSGPQITHELIFKKWRNKEKHKKVWPQDGPENPMSPFAKSNMAIPVLEIYIFWYSILSDSFIASKTSVSEWNFLDDTFFEKPPKSSNSLNFKQNVTIPIF